MKFEDLIIRQRAIKLYTTIRKELKSSKEKYFNDQILRAALSVSNNIAEWYERYSNKESIRFYYIAKASSAEVRSMILVWKEIWLFSEDSSKELYKSSMILASLIQNFIKSKAKK